MGFKSLLSKLPNYSFRDLDGKTHRFVQSSQTVVTDGDLQSSTYLATPSSEKSLAYYSNEKGKKVWGDNRSKVKEESHRSDPLISQSISNVVEAEYPQCPILKGL